MGSLPTQARSKRSCWSGWSEVLLRSGYRRLDLAHNSMGVSCQYSPVCVRGITSAMQRPIIPFPAREHRYLESAILVSKVNQPTAVSVVSTIMSSGRHAADWPQSPSEFPDLTPQPTGTEKEVWVDMAGRQRSRCARQSYNR